MFVLAMTALLWSTAALTYQALYLHDLLRRARSLRPRHLLPWHWSELPAYRRRPMRRAAAAAVAWLLSAAGTLAAAAL